MEAQIPLNAAAAGAVLLIVVAVGILTKAMHLLEKSNDVLADFTDAVRDLRVATLQAQQQEMMERMPVSGRGIRPATEPAIAG